MPLQSRLGGCPSQPLARSGQADFPHPALPPMWLVVTLAPLPSEVLVTCRSTSRRWTWIPPEVHTDTGRLCSAGSGRYPVPRRRRSYAALRLPASFGQRLRFPLPVAYLGAGACSVPMRTDDTCARNVSCVGDGSPALRKTGMGRGEARASQVPGPSSSYVPW